MVQHHLYLHAIWPCFKSHGSSDTIIPFYANEKDTNPRVELLREEHLDRLNETLELAFKNDPLVNYLTYTRDRKKPSRAQQKLAVLLWKKYMKFALKQELAYTVDAGYSALISTPPEKDFKRLNPIERLFKTTLLKMFNLTSYLNRSPEQRRRYQEFIEKTKALSDAHLPGDAAKDMVYIDLLATHPDYQGRGNATALLETVLFHADIRGRTVYLFTGNTVNIGFYGLFGFEDVGEALLGIDNPTWNGPPVRVPLMIRKPRLVKLDG